MKKILIPAVLALLAWSPPATAGETAEDPVLLLRHALLVGGRDGAQVPIEGEARSAEELGRVLVEWEPGEESEEIRNLFALEGLSEVIRQALVLPVEGGQSNSVYVHDGVSFEVRFKVRPVEDVGATAEVEIRRNGEWLAAPTVTTPFGERAIVSTTNGPEAPFLFLVVEVDRVSRGSVEYRALRYAGRRDLKTVEGDVQAPKAIAKTPPVYTEKARKEGVQGVVILQLVIEETGEVGDVEVLRGLPYGLTDNAVAAVRQWRFEPATLHGEPVAVLYNITINFRLQKEAKTPEGGEA